MALSGPRGYLSGKAVIRDANGNVKGEIEFKSEEPVSIEQIRSVIGDEAMKNMNVLNEGEL